MGGGGGETFLPFFLEKKNKTPPSYDGIKVIRFLNSPIITQYDATVSSSARRSSFRSSSLVHTCSFVEKQVDNVEEEEEEEKESNHENHTWYPLKLCPFDLIHYHANNMKLATAIVTYLLSDRKYFFYSIY